MFREDFGTAVMEMIAFVLTAIGVVGAAFVVLSSYGFIASFIAPEIRPTVFALFQIGCLLSGTLSFVTPFVMPGLVRRKRHKRLAFTICLMVLSLAAGIYGWVSLEPLTWIEALYYAWPRGGPV